MSDESTRLYAYLDKRFAEIDLRFVALEEKFDRRIDSLTVAVDGLKERVEICDHEHLVHGHVLDRHERWIHKLAKKTDTPLSY